MGGLNAITIPSGTFITYSRSAEGSYEMLLTNFVDGTDAAWLDLYVDGSDAVGASLVHPRDGLDVRSEGFGEEVHLIIEDKAKDGDAGPFAVVSLSREAAGQLADDINYMLEISKEDEG